MVEIMRRLKMNNKLYTMCGTVALAFVACSENSGVGGTSVEPNTVYAEDNWLWNPLAGDLSVNTARYTALLPEKVNADGHWFWNVEEGGTDNDEGGLSSIIWPVELGGGVDPLSTVIESCNGICGVADLSKGSLNYQPYVSVGFVIARDSAGNPTPVNVSDWGGVCITYASEISPRLVLDLGDSLRSIFDDGASFPEVHLAKTPNEISKCFSWDKFKIPSWQSRPPESWKNETGWKASKQLVGLMFVIQGNPGQYAFSIKYVGTAGGV